MHGTLRLQTVRAILVSIALFAAPAWAPDATTQGQSAKGTWTELKIGWGHRGALAVDRATGNLFGACWRGGGVVMSDDFGKKFTRVDDRNVTGNPFSAYALFAAADGGKMAAFSSQAGALSGHSLDGGKTWTPWTKVGAHGFDYGVVDWASGAIFVMPHEEYKAYFSSDMGKTWTRLDLDFPGGTNKSHQVGKFSYYQSGLGVFSAKELVYSHDSRTGIQRSEDGGKTWTKVADYFCQGPVQVCKGLGVWKRGQYGELGEVQLDLK